MSDVIQFPPRGSAPVEAGNVVSPSEDFHVPADHAVCADLPAAQVLGECAAECLAEVLVIGVTQDGRLFMHASGVRADRHYFLCALAQKAITS